MTSTLRSTHSWGTIPGVGVLPYIPLPSNASPVPYYTASPNCCRQSAEAPQKLRATIEPPRLVTLQVAHGLSALHADGGLHRNISARSVYLDERGRAKLGGYQFLKVSTAVEQHTITLSSRFSIKKRLRGSPPSYGRENILRPSNCNWLEESDQIIGGLWETSQYLPGSHIAAEQGVSDNSAGPCALHEGFGCAATAPPEYELHGETSMKVFFMRLRHRCI